MISKSCALALVTLAACSSQVDGDHRGTALATLSGTVTNRPTAPVDDAEVSVVWSYSSGEPDRIGGGSVEVEGDFPARFELSIYTPPDDLLLNDWDGVKVGVAYILANTPGVDWSDPDARFEDKVLGMDIDHLLVYVPQDVPAGSDASFVLRSTPKAGFHIYGVKRLTDAEFSARDRCAGDLRNRKPNGEEPTVEEIYTTCGGFIFDDFLPLTEDLETPLSIEIVEDFNTTDVPNWT
jgi:hypothetical protein